MSSARKILKCDPENNQRALSCVNDFISAKMSCHVPWLQNKPSAGKKMCTSTKELEEYYTLHTRISLHKLDDELIDFGCLKANCEENSWSAKILATVTDSVVKDNPLFGSFVHPDKSSLYFGMLTTQV